MGNKTKYINAISILLVITFLFQPSLRIRAQGINNLVSGRVTNGSGNGIQGVTVYSTLNSNYVFLPLIQNQGFDGIVYDWEVVSSPVVRNLSAVSMVSGSNGLDGWIVGSGGLYLRWNGTQWVIFDDGASKSIRAVSMSTATDGWAVDVGDANQGWIYHWNGISWDVYPHGGYAFLDSLSVVPGSGGTSVYAAGWWGEIWHWNGSSWSQINTTDLLMLYDIEMISDTDGWAVGGMHGQNETTGVILHWDGSSWQQVAGPNTGYWYNAIDAVSMNNAWVVGNHGTILQWDGSVWNVVTSPTINSLYGVSMVPESNGSKGWAVGANGTLLFWDGSIWVNKPSPTTESLNDIEIISASDGWVVGSNGIILKYH